MLHIGMTSLKKVMKKDGTYFGLSNLGRQMCKALFNVNDGSTFLLLSYSHSLVSLGTS